MHCCGHPTLELSLNFVLYFRRDAVRFPRSQPYAGICGHYERKDVEEKGISNGAPARCWPHAALRCRDLRILRSSFWLEMRPIPTPTPAGSLATCCRQLLDPCTFSWLLQPTICELASRCRSMDHVLVKGRSALAFWSFMGLWSPQLWRC